jgi:uncharacterized C2H2 Zn-finger protein
MKRAIIVENNNGNHEARCSNCGKLLFTFTKKSEKLEKSVDKTAQFVIIVSRCTRNSCKTDNEILISL